MKTLIRRQPSQVGGWFHLLTGLQSDMTSDLRWDTTNYQSLLGSGQFLCFALLVLHCSWLNAGTYFLEDAKITFSLTY